MKSMSADPDNNMISKRSRIGAADASGDSKFDKPSRIGNAAFGAITFIVIAHFILLAASRYIPSQRFLFAFYFVSLVFVPGYLLSAIFSPGTNLPVKIIVSAVFGTALLYLILIVFALFRFDIFFVGIVVPIISLALVLLFRFRVLKPYQTGGALGGSLPPIPAAVSIVLVILIVFATVLILKTGDPVYYTSDSPDHIAYIRAISRSHEAFPSDFLYREGGTLTRDIRKGLGHALWGTINVLTGRTDAYHIWPLISLFGSILIILSLFSAGVLLFRNATIGLLAAILFLLSYHGGLAGRQLITIAYSFPFGKIYLVAFLTALTVYFSRPRIDLLVFAAAASMAATGTHINHFLIIAFLIAVFSVVASLQSTGEDRKYLWQRIIPMLAIIIIGVNLPYLLLRYVRDYAPNNEIHTHIQGIFHLTDNLFIINPVVFLRISVSLSLLSLLSVFILWNRSRSDKNLRFLLWGVIAVYGTVFNPILVPLIISKISYLLLRLEFAIPSVLVSAYLLYALWNRTRGRKSSLSVRSTVIGWIAVLLLIGYPLLKTPSGFAYSAGKLSKLERSSCLDLAGLFEKINEDIPAGSVIASDPVTSYSIPAFTDQFVVCTFDQHSIPNDSTALVRILDCRDIFLPGMAVGEIAAMLNTYDAGYLVINGRIPSTISPMYWRPDRRDAAYAVEKFSRASDLFKVIYHKDSLTLFEYTNRAFADSSMDKPHSDRFLGPEVDIREALALPDAGEPDLHVKAVRVNRTSASRGDTLHITIEWVATRELNPRSYIARVRFDTHFEKGPLYSDSYGKIYRKILERIRTHRFRFTTEHLPLNGTYPPDKWPTMQVVRDALSVRIPDDIATGVYSISIKMSTKTHYPNYTLKDIFTNEDQISGVVMAKILIE